MSEDDLRNEVLRLAGLCSHYELQWHRATSGAVSANKAVRRLKQTVERLKAAVAEARDDARIARAELERATHDREETEKRVQRLSLRILDLWGRE